MAEVAKQVKISFESFLQKDPKDALYWNKAIGSRIMFGSKTKKYFCKECSFWDSQKANMVNHVELKHLHSFPGYTCVLCQLVFQTWFIFKTHVQKNHCSNPTEVRNSLKRLSDTKIKIPQIQAVNINSVKAVIINNVKIVEKSKPPKPKIPKFKPQKPHHETADMSPVRFYGCGKCNSKYTLKDQLSLHYKIAHSQQLAVIDEMSFQVPVYDKERKPLVSDALSEKIPIPNSILEKRTDRQKHNPKRPKTVTHNMCRYCPELFVSPSCHAKHEATHDGFYVYNCHLCNCLGFREEYLYIEHMITNHGSLNIEGLEMTKCSFDYCQQLFPSSEVMRNHVNNYHYINLSTIPIPAENLDQLDLSLNQECKDFLDQDSRFEMAPLVSTDSSSQKYEEEPFKEMSSSESSSPDPESSPASKLGPAAPVIHTPELESEGFIFGKDISSLGSIDQYDNIDELEDDEGSEDPLAIEPGELFKDIMQEQTSLEETVIML